MSQNALFTEWEFIVSNLWILIMLPCSMSHVYYRYKLYARKHQIVQRSEAIWLSFVYICIHFVAFFVIVLASSDNSYADLVRKAAVISPKEASRLIAAAESYAIEHNGWRSERGLSYPVTTDIAVENLIEDNIADDWAELIDARIGPLLEKEYKIFSPYWLIDLFVVKYDAEAQSRLARHKDENCELSFYIALSDSHRPQAVTTFVSFGDYRLKNISIGDFWVHPSKVRHKARALGPEEIRYLVVGFVHVDTFPTWWRSWGSLATTLREFHLSNDDQDKLLSFQSKKISRTLLFRRHIRASVRALFRTYHPFTSYLILGSITLLNSFVLIGFLTYIATELGLIAFFREVSRLREQKAEEQRKEFEIEQQNRIKERILKKKNSNKPKES